MRIMTIKSGVDDVGVFRSEKQLNYGGNLNV
jgi:hypothetical protein